MVYLLSVLGVHRRYLKDSHRLPRINEGIVAGKENPVSTHDLNRTGQGFGPVKAACRNQNVLPEILGKQLFQLTSLEGHSIPLVESAQKIGKRLTQVSQDQVGLWKGIENAAPYN